MSVVREGEYVPGGYGPGGYSPGAVWSQWGEGGMILEECMVLVGYGPPYPVDRHTPVKT